MDKLETQTQLDKLETGVRSVDVEKTAESQAQPAASAHHPVETAEIRSTPLLKSPGGRTAGRQAPPTGANKKKKKKKAVRPGQQTDGEVPLVTTSQEKLITTSEERLFEEDTDQVEEKTPSADVLSEGIDPAGSSDDVESTNQVTNENELSPENQSLVEIETQEIDDKVEESLIGVVAMETRDNLVEDKAESGDVSSPASLSAAVEDVVTDGSTVEAVAMDTIDESHALEEVFGNYQVELSGEEGLAALLQSYDSGIKKIR